MKKLSFDWENCFGIKELKQEFNFEKNHIQLIYAPNGTMKTSFAKTMKYIEKNIDKYKPKDNLNEFLIAKYDVKADENNIANEVVYVINGDDNIDSSESFKNFLASKVLKEKYEEISSEITKAKDALITKLKTISQSTDCENELLTAFNDVDNENIFSVLEKIYPQIDKSLVKYPFRYNYVFDKKGAVKAFVEKFNDELQNYIEKYETLLSQSSFYQKKNGRSFGTYQASQLCNSVEDDAFFAVNHKIVLQNQQEISSVDALKQIIKDEQNKILNDKDLQKIFDSITKAIDKNADLRDFKSVIEENPDLIPEIVDYDNFKKKVWLGYLSTSEMEQVLKDYNDIYNSNKAELEKVITEAGKQKEKWSEIINLYKSRFHVPFNVSIENQQDIILKSDTAKLKFTYLDEKGTEIETEKEKLENILSRGEKRAFNILQFIFDMESRKSLNQETLLIMDDISDSFDYQNKYAIIEYIKDLASSSNFYCMLLTHNYDFYRTVSSRLHVHGQNLWLVEKLENHKIKFNQGQYTGNVFTNAFVGNDKNDKIFISMLPFVRNLIEYTEGETSSNYLKLTYCLHHKKETKSISVSDIADIMENFTQGKHITHAKTKESFYDLVMKTAEVIAADTNVDSVKIENKIVLSIAIRLLAEEYMYNSMIAIGKKVEDFSTDSNQTGYWTRKMREFCPNDPNLSVIEEVNIMTPELIHLNSFMYEPLIDMSVSHLLELYKKVKILK